MVPKTNVNKKNLQANLLDHIGQAVMMVDTNRKICFWNNASENLYGWRKNEVLGRDVIEVLAGANSKDEVESITKWLNAGEAITTEYLAQRKDGSLVPININRASVYDEKDVYLGSAVSATDITEQKITERDMTLALESLSSSLDKIEELNEKLKVVGSLTRHDVRNKLSSVTGYSYILKKKHFDLADVVEGLDKMSQAVNDSMKIFEIAKTYEQVGVEELVNVDVAKIVEEAVELFPDLSFTVINNCQGLFVRADSLLRQLIFNFIDNTRKYGKTTKTVRVHFKKTVSGDLQLIYEDDGEGIPTENKEQLFKQGFSTGGSTGFGLFLAKKIVQVYGWSISEKGEAGKGTKLVMTIPKC